MGASKRFEHVLHRSLIEAEGYLELARIVRGGGGDDRSMRDGAIAALGRISDNVDVIDAFCELLTGEQEENQP